MKKVKKQKQKKAEQETGEAHGKWQIDFFFPAIFREDVEIDTLLWATDGVGCASVACSDFQGALFWMRGDVGHLAKRGYGILYEAESVKGHFL